MKKYVFFLLLCCSLTATFAQGNLRQKLDSLLNDPLFETTQVGLMVYDLTADQPVYQHHARQLMRPASTMKVITAITALDRLGGDYMFTTRLCYTGKIQKGKLTGNLYCVGGFDPLVTNNDIKDMVARLYEMGVDTLRGHVYADRSMKEAVDWGEGWCWDDDNPRLTSLTIGRQDTFTDCVVRELQNIGIVLQNVTIGEAVCPANAHLICPRFHTIDQVMERMMKKSDNFHAEALFYQIAASTGKPLCNADGSGLSLYNYVSPELETMLLRYAWQNSNIYDHLAPSLPIAGVDGTLEKRMRGTPAQGNVRAKTGTLTGISSLAGYCTAANGHQLCFCIINQGVMRGADGKAFQDRVCVALCEP